MKDIIIDPYSAHDIQTQVDKVLRGLGNPSPPLSLSDVRELLKLDKQYYSSTNDGPLREITSRIKIGAKQLTSRPSLIFEVIKKAQIKALWIPDRKRILIDQDVPEIKHRHIEAHEIIHGITPHHSRFLFGDDNETLRKSCHDILEAEANYGAGQLLFMRSRFLEIANDYSVGLNSILELYKVFGNSITMTLWHYVEEADSSVFGVVSKHPVDIGATCDPTSEIRYFIKSLAFRKQIASGCEVTTIEAMKMYSSPARGGPLGQGEVDLLGKDGKLHRFLMETFYNGYDALTLGKYLYPVTAKIAVN